MGALRPLLLAIVLLLPVAVAQPPADPTVVGDAANQARDTVVPRAENQSGEDVSTEEVDIELVLDIENAEIDVFGVLFGGGKAQTDFQTNVTIAFRAVGVDRLEAALQAATGEENASLSETFGFNTSRSALTADEIRAAGGGALLEAFQSYQEGATQRYIEDTVPQVTVLSTRFDWKNTAPEGPEERVSGPDEAPDPELREPPIVLDAAFTMRFLDRFSLADQLTAEDETNGSTPEDPADQLRKRIEENQTVPFSQRSAFMVVGIGQLLSLELPSGWRMDMTVTVPKGFTISGATDALVLSEDHQEAAYYMDGSQRELPVATSGVITVSDRSLVTMVLAGGTLLAGLLLRVPVELGFLALWGRFEGS